MRLRLLGTVAAAAGFIAITASVQAADIAKPVKPVAPVVVKAPVLLFQGHYFGLVGGYGWGTTSAEAIPAGAVFSAANIHPKGWLAGVTVGSNWQGPNHVFGIEGDIAWANIHGSGEWAEDDSFHNPWDSHTNTLATLRVRWGHPFGTVMPYVTGGLAWQNTRVHWSYELGDCCSQGEGQTQTFHLNPWGWTVGVGIEVAHSPKVSWKIEYLYAGFGSKSEPTATISDDQPDGIKYRNNIQMVRFGVNFKFP